MANPFSHCTKLCTSTILNLKKLATQGNTYAIKKYTLTFAFLFGSTPKFITLCMVYAYGGV